MQDLTRETYAGLVDQSGDDEIAELITGDRHKNFLTISNQFVTQAA